MIRNQHLHSFYRTNIVQIIASIIFTYCNLKKNKKIIKTRNHDAKLRNTEWLQLFATSSFTVFSQRKIK